MTDLSTSLRLSTDCEGAVLGASLVRFLLRHVSCFNEVEFLTGTSTAATGVGLGVLGNALKESCNKRFEGWTTTVCDPGRCWCPFLTDIAGTVNVTLFPLKTRATAEMDSGTEQKSLHPIDGLALSEVHVSLAVECSTRGKPASLSFTPTEVSFRNAESSCGAAAAELVFNFSKSMDCEQLKSIRDSLLDELLVTSADLDSTFACPSLDQALFQLWGPADVCTVQEVLNCQQLQIYGVLKQLLPPAQFLPLGVEVITWLDQESIRLPNCLEKYYHGDDGGNQSDTASWDGSGSEGESETGDKGCANEFNRLPEGAIRYLGRMLGSLGLFDPLIVSAGATTLGSEDRCKSPEESHRSWYSDPPPPKKLFDLPSLCRALPTGIERLGGVVCPKLNWSAPKDAKWITGGRLCCETTKDVLLLLKASSWISHDLQRPFRNCLDSYLLGESAIHNATASAGTPTFRLCLKRWRPVRDGMEFRVFFWRARIVGVSQRDVSHCYRYLYGDVRLQEFIRAQLANIFRSECLPAFNDAGQVWRGCLDVWFATSEISEANPCRLMDVAPWGGSSDPLLFDWNELRDWALAKTTPLSAEGPQSFTLRLVTPEMSGKRTNAESRMEPYLHQDMLHLAAQV